jgi:hypothetical protein
MFYIIVILSSSMIAFLVGLFISIENEEEKCETQLELRSFDLLSSNGSNIVSIVFMKIFVFIRRLEPTRDTNLTSDLSYRN